MYMELKEYKKEIGISFIILMAFYIIVVVYKKFNPFDFPGLEKKMLYVLVPLGIVSVLFLVNWKKVGIIFEWIEKKIIKFIEKINRYFSKLENSFSSDKKIAEKSIKNHSKRIEVMLNKFSKLLLIAFIFLLNLIKRTMNIILDVNKKVYYLLNQDLNKNVQAILSFGLAICCFSLFFVRGFETIIVLAFVFSCSEGYLVLKDMKSHKAV